MNDSAQIVGEVRKALDYHTAAVNCPMGSSGAKKDYASTIPDGPMLLDWKERASIAVRGDGIWSLNEGNCKRRWIVLECLG